MRLFKKTILLTLSVLLILSFGACKRTLPSPDGNDVVHNNASINKPATNNHSGVSEKMMIQDISESGYATYYFSASDFDLPTEAVMNIVNIHTDKRMTEDQTDKIWLEVEMEDPAFKQSAFIKLSYQKYTEGGWRLDTIEYYKDSVFSTNGKPVTAAADSAVASYFHGAILDSLDCSGTEFTAKYTVNESHQNCNYTGYATVIARLNTYPAEDGKPVLYWDCSMDPSNVKIDWSNINGSWHGEHYTWGTDSELYLMVNGDDNVFCEYYGVRKPTIYDSFAYSLHNHDISVIMDSTFGNASSVPTLEISFTAYSDDPSYTYPLDFQVVFQPDSNTYSFSAYLHGKEYWITLNPDTEDENYNYYLKEHTLYKS